MQLSNPYAAPEHASTPQHDDELSARMPLASRGARLAARMIDGFISSVVFLPLMFWLDLLKSPYEFSAKLLILVPVSVAFFFAVHGLLLARHGQTVGKKLMGIRIANLDGSKAAFSTIVFKRYLPEALVGSIPFAGGYLALANILCIFGSSRRCGHDFLAGTVVIGTTN